MWPKATLCLKPKLHLPGRALAVSALVGLTTASAGLLFTAPGSLALTSSSARANRADGSAHRHPGYRRGLASWYYDSGATACGFHAKFGVANRTLPCGTKVNFIHDGHRLTATVDDRGPYVAGRTWDLGQRTARALHLTGVEYVWAKW